MAYLSTADQDHGPGRQTLAPAQSAQPFVRFGLYAYLSELKAENFGQPPPYFLDIGREPRTLGDNSGIQINRVKSLSLD